MVLSWGAVANADGYQIEHGVQLSGTTTTATTTATSHTFSGLTNGQFYVFRVQATDSGGDHTTSAYSGWVTAMPLAQTATRLVSNLAQTNAHPTQAGSVLNAATNDGEVSAGQAFTTGASPVVLESIELDVFCLGGSGYNAAESANVRVELWSANSSGAPDARLAELEVPTTLPVGPLAFKAPAGTELAANTTYHVVFYSLNNQDFAVSATAVDADDPGAAPGWTIADDRNFVRAGNPTNANWGTTSSDNAVKMAVRGYPPLVSNLAQADQGGRTSVQVTGGTSEAFTTGDSPAGYVLSGIEVNVRDALNATQTAKVRAELWSASADGTPNARLETMTVPSTLSAGVNAFTAPPGTVLAPDTTYHVVFYPTTETGHTLFLIGVEKNAEDSGAAAGWSIADARHETNATDPNSPGAHSWRANPSFDDVSLKIAVKGAARAVGSGKPIWSGTLLLPADRGGGLIGCEVGAGSGACRGRLSNDDFAYDGSSRTVATVQHLNDAVDSSRRLTLEVSAAVGDAAFKELTLHVGGRPFAVADATVTHPSGSQAVWSSTGMVWSTSDEVPLLLTIPETSSNNDLSALSATTATSETGTYSTQTLTPDFTAGTTSYSATVPNAVTHAKLTAAVDDTGKATMVAGRTGSLSTLGDGVASGAIALEVGDNALVVRVTAENGDEKDYTVTIRRQSANADLAALAASTATSANGMYSTLALSPGFSAGRVEYSAEVGSSVSHAKLTATAAEPGTGDDPVATLKVGKQGATLSSVRSGSASDPIALVVGDNVLVVEVTAENGNTKTYEVTIRRREPSADLSALSVSVATSETGTYSPAGLSPVFAAGTTSYSVSAARDVTHAKVTASALETGATLQVGKTGSLVSVASGDESAPIALVRGRNDIVVTVAVTAGGTTVDKTYTVAVNVAAKPFAMEGLVVTPVPHGLHASWDEPGVEVDGYDVQYTSMPVADLVDDAPAGSNRLAYLGWVDIGHDHREPKAGIGGLSPSQEYRVRVRAYNSFGTGPWAAASGTPAQAPLTVVLSASSERVREGDEVTITATVMHNGRPTVIQEDLEVLLSTHLGTAEAGDVGTAERILIEKYTDSGSVTIPTHRDGDGDDERFAVLIRWIPSQSAARVGHPSIVWVTVTEGDPAPPKAVIYVPELRASGGDGALHLTWSETAVTGNSGYDVEYKRSSAPNRDATTDGDPATGWVDAGHTGTERSMTISGLGNGVSYDARVRLAFRNGNGAWSEVVSAQTREPANRGGASEQESGPQNSPPEQESGSPQDSPPEQESGSPQDSPPEQEAAVLPSSVTLSLDAATVAESAGTVTVTATLDAPAPDGGIGGFLSAGADSTATADVDYTMPLAIFIPGGQRSATATVTVTDDDIDETDETVAISALFDVGTAVLEDTITLTITDDDTAAVTVTASNPLSVSEGATATYTVVLDSQPTADVTVTAASSDTGAVSVSPASATFTSATWSTPVTFTITGTADTDTNDETVAVSHSVTSDDANYAAAITATVTVSVTDTTTPPPQQQAQERANQPPTVASAITDSNGVSDAYEVTVTAPQSTLTGIAARYDANGDGAIDGSEYQQVKNDWLAGKITHAEFLEIVRIYLSSG